MKRSRMYQENTIPTSFETSLKFGKPTPSIRVGCETPTRVQENADDDHEYRRQQNQGKIEEKASSEEDDAMDS